jgi:hypothetical protein
MTQRSVCTVVQGAKHLANIGGIMNRNSRILTAALAIGSISFIGPASFGIMSGVAMAQSSAGNGGGPTTQSDQGNSNNNGSSSNGGANNGGSNSGTNNGGSNSGGSGNGGNNGGNSSGGSNSGGSNSGGGASGGR